MSERQEPADDPTAVERRLRERLRAAADQAPTFDPGGWQSAGGGRRLPEVVAPSRHRWPIAVAAAALALILLATGLWVVTRDRTGQVAGGSAGSCAEVLNRHGQLFQPHETVRIPRRGERLGRAYWCQDTGPDWTAVAEVVYAASGIPAGQGFWFDHRIWLRTDLDRLPAAIGELQAPVDCRRPTTLVGSVEQIDGQPRPGEPVTVTVPYTVGVRVRHGLGKVAMGGYDSVRLSVRITGSTRGAARITRLAQRTGLESVRLEVVCRGDRFVATRAVS